VVSHWLFFSESVARCPVSSLPRQPVHDLLGHTAYRRSSPGGMHSASILDGPGQRDKAETIPRHDHVFHAVAPAPPAVPFGDQQCHTLDHVPVKLGKPSARVPETKVTSPSPQKIVDIGNYQEGVNMTNMTPVTTSQLPYPGTCPVHRFPSRPARRIATRRMPMTKRLAAHSAHAAIRSDAARGGGWGVRGIRWLGQRWQVIALKTLVADCS
jgi:hypothetical protein